MSENHENNKQTKLYQQFKFWFTFFKKKEKQVDEFEENLKEIGTIGTAEEFWGIYQHMKRPTNLNRGCEFFLFKKDIKPMWEHEANHNGGRFLIVLKKNINSNKIWEDILIAFIMLEDTEDHLNGVVLNVRNQEIHISIWTKALSVELYERSLQWLKNSIECPPECIIEYKKHPTQEEMTEMHAQPSKEAEDKTTNLPEHSVGLTNSRKESSILENNQGKEV